MSMLDELPPLGEGDTLYDELFNERMEQKWQSGIQQGRAEGRAEGKAEGKAEGREEGIEQGQRQALMTAAHNMLQQGFDVATIAKCLSLEEAEVLQIQADLS